MTTVEQEPFGHGTAKEYLDWCVERAMEYANAGNMPAAWASFISDAKKHDGTAHIPEHLLFGMAMMSGTHDNPRTFEDFISGWAVAR